MSKQLQEITPKAIVLGILLSMILAGANAYLGLFAGMTVSASIPAAVISMGILSLFRKSNILENNGKVFSWKRLHTELFNALEIEKK